MVEQAVILCGGFGKRLGSLVKDTPKPMLELAGKPILRHITDLLKKHGIKRAILLAGYKGEVVEKYFSQDWGIEVEVFIEPEPLGTSGAFQLVKEKLDDNFLVIYGDTYFDFDVSALIKYHEENNPLGTILTKRSTHHWNTHLIQHDKEHKITEFVQTESKDHTYQNEGNATFYILNKKILDYIPKGKPSGFFEEVFPDALNAGETLLSRLIEPSGYTKDLGKPEKFEKAERYIKDKKDAETAKYNPSKITTAFIDRDGVLNREVNFLSRPDQLEILDGVPEAINLLNRNGIRTVLVTNQPVLARGMCTESTLNLIHQKLSNALANGGGRLNALYYCPHHPETQYGDGVPELRIGCRCRKPSNGMIMQAKDEHGIDLSGAVMIGDSTTDIEAGINSGIRTILINSGNGRVKPEGPEPDKTYDSLLEAARDIVGDKI